MGQTYDHRSSTMSRGLRRLCHVRQQQKLRYIIYILFVVILLFSLPAIFISFRIIVTPDYDLGLILPMMRRSRSPSSIPPGWNLIVVAPTFYKDINEGRLKLALESCRLAVSAAKNNKNIKLILVDASPKEEIRSLLQQTNADKSVINVVKQSSIGKGAALKEAIQLAQEEIIRREQQQQNNNNNNSNKNAIQTAATTTTTVIAFMELEKVDMFRHSHWENLVYHMYTTKSDITMPWRSDESFKRTYPVEQYYAETFANLYLNSLGTKLGMTPLDWTIGPVAFQSTMAKYWLDYDSGGIDSYDVQLIPVINAHLMGAKITSYEIDYEHSPTMKQMEEGSPIWSEKRFMQLDFHRDVTAKKLKEAIAAAAAAGSNRL